MYDGEGIYAIGTSVTMLANWSDFDIIYFEQGDANKFYAPHTIITNKTNLNGRNFSLQHWNGYNNVRMNYPNKLYFEGINGSVSIVKVYGISIK